MNYLWFEISKLEKDEYFIFYGAPDKVFGFDNPLKFVGQRANGIKVLKDDVEVILKEFPGLPCHLSDEAENPLGKGLWNYFTNLFEEHNRSLRDSLTE